jgi:hypothetical protein
MKNIKKFILLIQFIFVGLLLLLNISCDNEEYTLPELTTTEVTEIGQVTATGGGTVTNDGGAGVIARGVCWSTNPGPVLDDNATNDGIGTGTYTSAMANLSFGTTYYVRSFAINSEEGLAYGNEISFETSQPEGVDCPADLWDGDMDCQDGTWPSYSPTYCMGEKMDGDCNLLNITLDFWGYGSSTEVVFELQLEPLDLSTYEGEVTLTKDAFVTAEGADITFHQGAAGTYKALSGELLLDIAWSGYDATASYKWTVTPKE